MNTIQSAKWQQDFETAAKALQIEYDAFFIAGNIQDSYRLQVDERSNMLSLVILNSALPHDMQTKLADLLVQTKPSN
jgi:mannitol/fructose-specific phosphotransferase system IIA component